LLQSSGNLTKINRGLVSLLFNFAVVTLEEIHNALKDNLGLYFSREEVRLLTKYLDEDESGTVDIKEF